MPISRADLGATACRALMRDLDDRPLVLDLWVGLGQFACERTGNTRLIDQWTVAISPTLDWVSVVAHGQGWEFLPLPDSDTGRSYLLRYPANAVDIIGPDYAAQLRAAVDKALQVVERDYARVQREEHRSS